MTRSLLCALALVIFVTSCGVKNDLEIPSGQPANADEIDPSRPPQPLGQ